MIVIIIAKADNILEEQDLVDMDITDASHRRRILESAKNLPKLQTLPPADSTLAPCSVGDWLSSLHLPEYETAFHANQYNSMAQVRTMSEYEVKPVSSDLFQRCFLFSQSAQLPG